MGLEILPMGLESKVGQNGRFYTTIDIKIHQVRYENGAFYLAIDNIKGYFSFSDNINVLSMIFSNDDQKINIIKYGKKFLKLLMMKIEN